MNVYDSNLMDCYRNAQKRVKIYDAIIKDHKKLLKSYDKDSKEYKELVELIDFVKGLDDYKQMNKNVLYCLLGMSATK